VTDKAQRPRRDRKSREAAPVTVTTPKPNPDTVARLEADRREEATHRDFITVLTADKSDFLTKRFIGADRKKLSYGNALWFGQCELPVKDLKDLREYLWEYRQTPHCCFIRGRYIQGSTPSGTGGLVRRISQPKRRDKRDPNSPIDPAVFASAAHYINMIDDDGKATSVICDGNDLKGTAKRWRAALPECLRDVGMLISFSASQRPGELVRAHAWFESETPLEDAQLRRFTHRHNLDRGLYNPVQPHYVADPIFDGCTDPMPSREIIVLRGRLARLDFTAEDLAASTPPRKSKTRTARERVSITIDELPEARVDAAALEARAKIAAPLSSYFEGPGCRWELCGYVGGACANAGIPAAECAAILDLLRADDVDDYEAAAGLNWALGAYDCEEPKGISGVVELTTGPAVSGNKWSGVNVTAHVFGSAVDSYALEFAAAPNVDDAPAAAPEPEPTAEPAAPLSKAERCARLGRVADLSKPPAPPEYICEQLGLAAGKLTAIQGYAGTSKGPMLALLALCLAADVAFLGMAVKRRRVVLWDFETGPIAETRLHRIANALGVDVGKLQAEGWLVLIHATPPLTADHLIEVRALATPDADGQRAIDVLLFDSYTSAVPGDQNAAEYAYVGFQLGSISNDTGITVIGAFHEKKTSQGRRGGSDLEMVSGTNALAAAMQTAVSLTRPKDDDPTLIEVRCSRAPEEGFKPFRFRWEDVPAPEGKETLGGRLKHGKWGLRAVLVAAPAAAVDDTRAQETSDLEAKHARAIVKYLTALPGRAMRSIVKDVSGFEPALKRLTLAMAEEGILIAHSKPLEEGKTLTTYTVAQPNPGNHQARLRRGLHLTGVK
jgi:hypothetical protein